MGLYGHIKRFGKPIIRFRKLYCKDCKAYQRVWRGLLEGLEQPIRRFGVPY
jgi:hypothetical protein